MEEKDGEEAQTHTHRTEQTDKQTPMRRWTEQTDKQTHMRRWTEQTDRQTHMRRWTEQDRLTKMAFGNGNLGSQNFA